MTQSGHSQAIADLEDRLGYCFQSRHYLEQALTHASAWDGQDTVDYERLEFLGDRVLALLAADALLDAYPAADEGGLASRLNALVRKETCAAIAGELDLGQAVILSLSEGRSGVRANEAILADICEAILGAVFLDGGLAAVRSVFDRFWGHRVAALVDAPQDPKSALQEWAQAGGLPLPDYVVVSQEGPDHEPEFVVEVRLQDHEPGRGTGPNKKTAERRAAGDFLTRMGLRTSSRENTGT